MTTPHFDAGKFVDYVWNLREERDNLLIASQRLKVTLLNTKELINRGNFSTGYCMCGGSVVSHGIGDGHSPADEGDYYAGIVVKQLDEALESINAALNKKECAAESS